MFFSLIQFNSITDASIDERHETASSLESDASNVALLPENGQSSLDFSSVNIPSDQMRMIQNINALISEVYPTVTFIDCQILASLLLIVLRSSSFIGFCQSSFNNLI